MSVHIQTCIYMHMQTANSRKVSNELGHAESDCMNHEGRYAVTSVDLSVCEIKRGANGLNKPASPPPSPNCNERSRDERTSIMKQHKYL